jgi:hypothetical protein
MIDCRYYRSKKKIFNQWIDNIDKNETKSIDSIGINLSPIVPIYAPRPLPWWGGGALNRTKSMSFLGDSAQHTGRMALPKPVSRERGVKFFLTQQIIFITY